MQTTCESLQTAGKSLKSGRVAQGPLLEPPFTFDVVLKPQTSFGVQPQCRLLDFDLPGQIKG